LAWSASACIGGVAKVLPRSSVWISSASGTTRRISRIASSTPRHSIASMRRQSFSLCRCGYQCPYSPENRAVVSGSFTGVHIVTQGKRRATCPA
jgi:hypothetical protein